MTKRKFFLEGKPDTHLDHFVVLGEGKLSDLAPTAPVEEGAELMLDLGEVDRHDGSAAVGKVEGFAVVVADASSLVGKKVKVRVERVLDGTAYATLLRRAKKAAEPLTAEAEAEKPTRKPPARKGADAAEPDAETAETLEAELVEDELDAEPEAEADAQAPPEAGPKKRTRRGSRGGKKRHKPADATAEGGEAPEADEGDEAPEAEAPAGEKRVTIHVPADDLGREEGDDEVAAEAPSENGAAPAKKKTRRGSRGGKNRRKRTAAATATPNGGETVEEAPADVSAEQPLVEEPEPAPAPVAEPADAGAPDEEWSYVPMSEWGDQFER